MAEAQMPAGIRLAWLTLRLWDGGILLADGGRLWAGSQKVLADELGMAKHYVAYLLGQAVVAGYATIPAGSRGCWIVSPEARDRAAVVWSEAEKVLEINLFKRLS